MGYFRWVVEKIVSLMLHYAFRFKGNVDEFSSREIDALSEILIRHEKSHPTKDLIVESSSGLRYLVCEPTIDEYRNGVRTIKPLPAQPAKPVVKRSLARSELRERDEMRLPRFIRRF